jgi:hypothetical protein
MSIHRSDLTLAAISLAIALAGCDPGGNNELLSKDLLDNAPPDVSLANTLTSIAENADVRTAIDVADIIVTDDTDSAIDLSLSGPDASLFEIVGEKLRLRSRAELDFETHSILDVTVEADDPQLAGAPDDSASLSITVKNAGNAFINGQNANTVIGQADFVSDNPNQGRFVTGTGFDYTYGNPGFGNGVFGNTGDGRGILYLPDHYNRRVLGFKQIPSVNNQHADFVLGQFNFYSNGKVGGSGGMDAPLDSILARKFLVVDLSYSRATIYDPAPTAGPQAAAVTVGQANFFDSALACTRTGLALPEAGTITPDGKIIIADSENYRVMIWNQVPTASGEPADLVLGQPDFTSCSRRARFTDPTARDFDYPSGIWSDGDKLIVLDHYNNRALIWTSFPTANGQAADLVLGQADFTHFNFNDDNQNGLSDLTPSARTLFAPGGGVYFSGTQLCIADTGNSRVLIWDAFPSKNFEPANRVIGQPDFASGIFDRGGKVAANTLDMPAGCLIVGTRLIVSDTENSRFLVYEEP